MRFSLIFCCLGILILSACKGEDNNTGGANFSAMSKNISSSAATLKRVSFAESDVASAPPSQMALDRSKFKGRRIAETQTVKIDLKPDQLKSRYDRDLQKCLELECEIINSKAQSRRSGFINARIDPENLGAYLDFLGSGPGEFKEHSVLAHDKTVEYIDNEAKVKNLERLRTRLIALLNSKKTRTVNEVLQIERELNRVEQKLDSALGSMIHLKNVTDKATVFSQYNVPFQDFQINTYAFKNSFKRAQQEFLDSVSSAIRFVGGVIPWLPVWVIGLWLGVKALKFAFGKSVFPMLPKKRKKPVQPQKKAVKS